MDQFHISGKDLKTEAIMRFKIWKYEIEILQVVGIAAFLIVWQIMSMYLRLTHPYGKEILPPPLSIITEALPGVSTFWGGGMGGTTGTWFIQGTAAYLLGLYILIENSAITTGRLLLGTSLGLVIGVGTGLAMGWSKKVRLTIAPVVHMIRVIPPLALIPLFMLWFSQAEIGKILFVAFVIASMIVVNTIEAIRNVPPIYINASQTLGATRGQVYRTIVIPAITPALVGGIRVAIGLAWAVVLGAEYLGAQSGLGRLLIISETFFDTGRMILAVICFALLSIALNYIVVRILRKRTRWI